jgi:type VI secretion system secreted protein Hcp
MAADIFIKFDGVEGESTDGQFKNHCEVLSFSWGLSQAVSFTGGGMGAGKANFQDFSFTKQMDASSTRLMQRCATGEHFKKVEVFARKAGGKQMVYLKFLFEECLITNYQTGSSGEIASENVTVAFGKVKIEYHKQDLKGGTAKVGDFGYDVKKNEAI